jgi:outer membrane protein assembly factor BamB
MGDLVIVAASGKLAAYDLATGSTRWSRPADDASFSSPRLVTIDGVPQVLLLRATVQASVAPADGTLLWQHQWKGYPIVQPALSAEGDILISINESSGVRRLAVAHGQNAWNVEERWTSKRADATAMDSYD